MRRVVLLAWNDVRLTVRDRTSFIWMLMLPVALMWIFGSIGYSGTPSASLTVVDHDGGWLARAIVDELGGDEQIVVRELAPADAATAEGKVRTLHIPAGFTADVLAGSPRALRLEKEADTNEDFALAAQTRVVRVVVRTIGRLAEIGLIDADGDPTETGNPQDRFAALRDRASLVALEVTTAGQGRPVPSGRAQSVPGILTMTVMMMTIIYGAVFLTEEKRQGVLRRQMTLPVGRIHVFAGKLVGRLFLAGLQTVVLLAIGRFLYGLSYGESVAGLVVLMSSYCLAVAGLATFLGAVLQTPEQAGSIGWLLGMVLAALGGCWWPSEIMPEWMWLAAHALPTAWAMDGFHALISFGYGLDRVVGPSAALLGFAVVFSFLGARFLRVSA